jgi:hypothetical protein
MFDDAVARGADVISVAATLGPRIIDAAQRAIDAGVIVVGAAGADDVLTSKYPSDMAGAVSVYAVDEHAKPWRRQRNTGFPVISAPGVFVGNGGFYEGRWTSNAWTSGTSPATSITAGALALVKSAYPEATGNQILQHLIHYPGGDGPYTWDEEFGFGIVSVIEMLETDPAQWPDENPLGRVLADAVTDYPMEASSIVKGQSAGSGDTSAETGTDDGSAADDAGERAATEADESGDGTDDADDDTGAAAAGDLGTPAWVWLLAGLVLAAVVAGVLIARRGARRTTAAAAGTRGA